MPVLTEHSLQKRPFHLDDRKPLSARGIWFEESPLATQLLNAYTLLIPEGERFVIRSCRREMHKVEPALQEELRLLFFQEGSHSREHGRLLNAMSAEGLALVRVRKVVDWISYRVLERVTPSILRVATAAAIEHHNAVIATHFLDQDLLKRVQPGETRRLLLWHFAEEIEHKETAFKLLRRLSPSRVVRTLGLFVSCATFLTYLAMFALLLGIKTRAVLTRQFWREALASWRMRDGLAVMLARESWRYLAADFEPRLAESRELLDSALAELERLGVERPTPRPVPTVRELPEAFRHRMGPSLERVRITRSSHPYFGAALDGYDGAWMLTKGQRKLNFCTYSYLGLLGHPQIQEAATRAVDRYGTGTHGVRLLGGNLDIHEALEARLAAFFQREAALTFSSGFMTNVAAIAALTGTGDHVLSDAMNHASIIDGCRLSRAEATTFRHNDMQDLATQLGRLPAEARKLVIVDAVFSMDGDIAPLDQLLALRDRCPNTLLMVDEAHSLGVLGRHGRGIEEHFACVGGIDVLMGTLSKTIPAQGGYIAGSLDLITYLRFNARGFVFSASLPPATTAAALAALDLIETEGLARRARLLSNVDYFVARLRDAGFDVGRTESAIVPILIGDESRAFDMARRCHLESVYAMPVAFPAVPRGTERLRMNVTCNHHREDLDYALSVLNHARSAAVTGAIC